MAQPVVGLLAHPELTGHLGIVGTTGQQPIRLGELADNLLGSALLPCRHDVEPSCPHPWAARNSHITWTNQKGSGQKRSWSAKVRLRRQRRSTSLGCRGFLGGRHRVEGRDVDSHAGAESAGYLALDVLHRPPGCPTVFLWQEQWQDGVREPDRQRTDLFSAGQHDTQLGAVAADGVYAGLLCRGEHVPICITCLYRGLRFRLLARRDAPKS